MNASFAPSPSMSMAISSNTLMQSPASSINNASGNQHWSMQDRAHQDVQTDDVDSMRKMLGVFQTVVASVRDEIEMSQDAARDRYIEWERTYRFNLWQWDATLAVVREGEERERAALVMSEKMWREQFFQNVVALCLHDFLDC